MLKLNLMKSNILKILLINKKLLIYFILNLNINKSKNIYKLLITLNKINRILKTLNQNIYQKNYTQTLSLYLFYTFFIISKCLVLINNNLISNQKFLKKLKNYIILFITKYLIFKYKQSRLIAIHKLITMLLLISKTLVKYKKLKLREIKTILSDYEKSIFCSLTKLNYKLYYTYKTKIDKKHIFNDIEFNYKYVIKGRALLNSYNFVSIDEKNTIEIDDVICVNKINNKTEILIGIADLSEYIPLSLFHLAYNNLSSLYFIYNNFYMLINKKIIKNFSLIKNSIRPALIFRLLFSKNLELLNFEFDFKVISIKENYSYELADKYKLFYEYNINKIAEILFNDRLNKGGIFLNIPRFKLDKNLKKIEPIYTLNNYRFIIQELMIITNYIASKIAMKHNIPFAYLHNNSKIDTNLKGKIITNPLEIYNITKNLEFSFYSLSKKNHNLIGLKSYTHITSPIRRFIDIINQRQLLSIFYNTPPYYDEQELTEFIKITNNENLQKNNLYRNYFKYYIKHFLYFNNINTLKGYVINTTNNMIKIYLSDYFLEIEENKDNIKILKGDLAKNQEIIFKFV
jgi:hypothetical protein